MILDTTTKSLTIVLGEAKTTTDCDITASWADQTPDQFLPGNNTLVSNGTGAVTVVPAPAVAGIERQVQEVTLYNNDTVSHTVFLREHDGANTRVITSATLAANASFRWPQASVPTGGTVTNIATAFGITGGPITNAGTISSVGSLLNTQSGDYTVQNSDVGKYIVMTKATAATLTLTAANLTTGWWAIVTQALTGTTAANKVLTYTPTTGTFDGAASGVDYPGAQRLIEFDGTNFNTVLLRGGFLEVLNSDSPFTAAKPTRAVHHRFFVLGPGGGGGSGRRGASASDRGGGTGGGGGGSNQRDTPDAYITTSITFTVPAGLTGGGAQASDNTNGLNGASSTGVNTLVTFNGASQASAGAGGSGAGGQAATALRGGAGGGTGPGATGSATVSQGGTPNIDIASVTQAQIGGANGPLGTQGYIAGQGGASGGGTANPASAGKAGNNGLFGGPSGGSGGGIPAGNTATGGAVAGGGQGATAGTAGNAGTSGVAGGTGGNGAGGPTASGHGGGGGGGGSGFDNTGGGTASAGGPGGVGGIGGGGGGGGASLNGNNSGPGGDGGPGLARWWYN